MPPPPHSQWDLKDLAPDVAEFFDRAKTITPREARLLNEMRYATYSEVAHNAQITARAAIGEEAVWQMSLLIDEQRNEARAEHHANAHDNVRDDEWNRAQIDAMTPVWDACLALTARDTISEEQFNVLYRPWKTVMEKEN
jgi:hypothetical protein